MQSRLADVVFDLPDDWRDTTTHEFRTADESGNLVVESERNSASADEVFEAALAEYSGMWGGMIIYTNRIQLRRGNGQPAPAAEGEQLAMDEVSRMRFALVALSAAGWIATLRFLMPSSPRFLPLVQRVVASAHVSGETWPVVASSADTRTVQAGPVSLQIPADFRSPDTFDFLHPTADEVRLSVTVAKPMVPRSTVDWDALIAEPFRILNTVEAPPPPQGNDWETQWQLQLSGFPEPWLVQKAVTQVTAASVVTAVLQGPESKIMALATVWAQFRGSLRPGGGR
ncbi:MAG TPA: hypothetical protein VFK05_19625 [Polyangiaceae bacterium]|nr:hypothetical protein [Polyangiaceae bacterium]